MSTALATPPQESALAAAPSQHTALVGRQAVVDKRREIFGYELFSRALGGGPAPGDDATLLTILSHEGREGLVGRKTVFMHCSDDTLHSDQLDLIQPDGVVLSVVPPTVATPDQIAERLPRLMHLKKKGFKLAFPRVVLTTPFASWLALATYIKLDLSSIPDALLPALVNKAGQTPHVHLMATHVNTVAQHAQLAGLGVQLFQGEWLSQPVVIQARVIRPAQMTIIQLINLLRKDAELDEIEELLKRDMTLSFNLLRFINSSGFGLRCEVTSFRHATMILGQKNLLRWAALLLTASRDSAAPPAIGNTAIVRGRLTELLAAEMLAPEDCDNAFIVGVFSLLDVMLGVPMAQALQQLPLPEAVSEALLHRTGKFAPFLDLTIACERGEDEGFAAAAEALQLSNHQINWAHLQALAWADALMAP